MPRRWKSSPKRNCSAIGAAGTRRRRAERDPAKILKELSDLRIGAPGGARILRSRPLRRAADHGRRRVYGRVPRARVCGRRQAVCSGAGAASGVALHGAPAETAPLHKLGGEQWQKARRKAAQRIRDVAAEFWICIRAAPPGRAREMWRARLNIARFRPASPSRKPPIRPPPSTRCSPI